MRKRRRRRRRQKDFGRLVSGLVELFAALQLTCHLDDIGKRSLEKKAFFATENAKTEKCCEQTAIKLCWFDVNNLHQIIRLRSGK